MMQLSGRKIIVTGGASGMGQTLVEELPKLGAQVVSLDLNEEAGRAIAEKSDVQFVACNVADEASVTDSIQKAVELLGGLDVLVHAAGIAPASPAENITVDGWNTMMNVNATGTFLLNKAVFPYFKENGGGSILNFASASGVIGYPNKAHYAASKGAVIAWSRSLASEWGKYNIRVNMIAPTIWTPMYDQTRAGMTPEQLAKHDEMTKFSIPLGGKLGDPKKDFLPIMAFLCSDDAHYMTGQIFAIDGGALMLR